MKKVALLAVAALCVAGTAQAAPVADLSAPSTVGDSVTWEAEIIFEDASDGHFAEGDVLNKGSFVGGISEGGEELHYTIDGIVAGTYELATWGSNSNSINVFDGSDDLQLGTAVGPSTGGWGDFDEPGTIEFTAGAGGDIAIGDDFDLWVNGTSSNLDKLRLTFIPEPATMSLLALGGLGVLIRRRRRA